MKIKDLIEMLSKLNPELEIGTPEEWMKPNRKISYYENEGWVEENINE